MPTFKHGSKGHLKLGTASSETDISTYLTSSEMPIEIEEHDTTTYGTATDAQGVPASTNQPGLSSAEISFEGLWNETIDGILAPLRGVEGKSAVWGPAGSTAGLIKYSALGWLKTYTINPPVNGIVTFSGVFRVSGVVTRGTF